MRDKIKNSASKSIWKILGQTLIVFCFIYEIQPIGVPDMLTSRKIVFFLCLALFVLKRNFRFVFPDNSTLVGKTINSLFLLSIVMLAWVAVLSVINMIGTQGHGESILSRTLLFVFFTPLICFFMYDRFDDHEQFFRAVFFATLIQSVIVIADYFSDSVKVFLYNHFVLDANFSYLSPYRAAGLGAGEALLSLNLVIGLVACAYFLIKRRGILLYVTGYVLILFATMLSGTTGFVIGAMLLAAVLFYHAFTKKSFNGLKIVVIGILALSVLFVAYPEFFSSIERFQIFRKLSDFWKVGAEESSFLTSFMAQKVAPISFETIIGTSMYRGYSSGGLQCRSDSGYIQAYFGYGFIMAIVFYVWLYKDMLRNLAAVKDRGTRFVLLFFFMAIAVAEIKEPFIHHYGLPFAFFMSVFLYQKQDQRGNNYSQQVA